MPTYVVLNQTAIANIFNSTDGTYRVVNLLDEIELDVPEGAHLRITGLEVELRSGASPCLTLNYSYDGVEGQIVIDLVSRAIVVDRD